MLEGTRPTPRADVVGGGVWVALGVAIAIGSWNMDRLESQGVPWFTAPGLVPGILGVLIVIAALGIVLRALRRARVSAPPDAEPDTPFTARAGLTIALCLAFAAVAVGRVWFPLAAAVYLFLHIAILQYPERREKGQVARGLVVAAVIAVAASAAISTVFQEIFLVRLP